MNHATLTALMLSNQNSGYKLYNIYPLGSDVKLVLHYGAEIITRPDGSWGLTVDPRCLSQMATDFLNLHTNETFYIKKLGTNKFSFTGGFIGKKLKLEFKPDGTFTVLSGLILDDDELKAKTKALHTLTRRVRKKVQPQIRLLGAAAFTADRDKDNEHRWGKNKKEEVPTLMNILDGNEVVKNLNILRAINGMGEVFGNGPSWPRNKAPHELQPKKIVDIILRRVGKHKLEILEKYDERTRANQQNT